MSTSDPALFDADGFLVDLSQWSEPLAEQTARRDGFGPLEELQMTLLRMLRREYARHHSVTALSHACHLAGEPPTACSICSPAHAKPGASPACPIRAKKPKPACKPDAAAQSSGESI